MRVYVGNLAKEVTEDELSAAFAPFGVVGCRVHYDSMSGRATGFGFVEVQYPDKAVASLNGIELKGKVLRVSKAVDRLKTSLKSACN